MTSTRWSFYSTNIVSFTNVAPDQVAARAWLDTNLRLGRSIIFVAETNAGIQGFTQLYPALCSVDLVNYFVLYDLYVCDHARRGGIGRSLMEAARLWATAQGAARIDLETARSNIAGQQLYKRLGYQLRRGLFKIQSRNKQLTTGLLYSVMRSCDQNFWRRIVPHPHA